jgi:hypothetical protein
MPPPPGAAIIVSPAGVPARDGRRTGPGFGRAYILWRTWSTEALPCCAVFRMPAGGRELRIGNGENGVRDQSEGPGGGTADPSDRRAVSPRRLLCAGATARTACEIPCSGEAPTHNRTPGVTVRRAPASCRFAAGRLVAVDNYGRTGRSRWADACLAVDLGIAPALRSDRGRHCQR